MRVLYNTDDLVYNKEDLYNTFLHGYNVALSESGHKPLPAFNDWLTALKKCVLKPLTIQDISDHVLRALGHNPIDILVENRRYVGLVEARHLIVWFAWMYTTDHAKDIASFMGYKNHASVFHGVNTISNWIETDKKIVAKIDRIKNDLRLNGFAVTQSKRQNINMDTKYEVV